ncbi:IS1167 transposase [Streptococcus pneumoniae]|nr:IS1167 transposase [Streptococcus pneumoniae]
MTYNEKRQNNSLERFIWNNYILSQNCKDPNIKILDIINKDTHKEIIAKLDYDAPSCPECGSQMKKYDFQKPSKIPYLETTGMPTRILLRKR